MPSLGPLEILVIFIVALLVFGPNKLPELARQVGKGLAEFRRVQHHLRNELDDAIHSVMDDDQPKGDTANVPPLVTEPPPQLEDGALPVQPSEPVTVDSSETTEPAEVPPPVAPDPTPTADPTDTVGTVGTVAAVEPGPPPPRADDAS